MAGNREKILVVDDNTTNLTMVRELLKSLYEVYPASSAEMMFAMLERVLPDLILLDVAMPVMDGYEAIAVLKSDRRFAEIPVIFLSARDDLTSEMKGFELGATDYITKPFVPSLLRKRVENQLLLHRQGSALQKHTDDLSRLANEKAAEVQKLQNAIINAFADLVEFRDGNTGGHNMRAQLYMKALIDGLIAKGLYTDELSQWNMDVILPSCQLHDVGKIAIPDAILKKSEKQRTPEEADVLKTHVTVGVTAIKNVISDTVGSPFLRHALRLIASHHEKWDGTGYPDGLEGEAIPLEGRLMAVADAYDALTSQGPRDRAALPHGEARKAIEERAGTSFDPAIVEVFSSVAGEFERIARHEAA